MAAHIFSASPAGPRGTGGLSIAERSSALNGIWLCEDHSRILDEERGKNYPASTLQSWKALQEQRIANELRKVRHPPFGWLVSVEVERNPLFRPQAILSFGKVTLLVGANGTGKTALCEWLAGGAGYPVLLERWARPIGRSTGVRATLTLIVPDRHEFVLDFDGVNLMCSYDGVAVTDAGQIFRVRYIRETAPRSDDLDDVEYLSSIWSIHPYQVQEVLKEISAERFGFVRRAEVRPETIDDGEEGEKKEMHTRRHADVRQPQEVYAQIGDHKDLFSFRSLSGREKSQVIVSGGMALTHRDSRHGPAMLIVELGGQLLPDSLLSAYADRLADPTLKFQTILVSPTERPRVDWSGWSIARLEGWPPRVLVRQEVICGYLGTP